MLWNWYTVDACFLSSTWHVTSKGMFAGSCIGVIALVLLLEFLRRLQREYDRFILMPPPQRHDNDNNIKVARGTTSKHGSSSNNNSSGSIVVEEEEIPARGALLLGNNNNWKQQALPLERCGPSVSQQAVRAGIHTMQFSVAYMIMLLAMYFNGYIILSIFIGVFIGFFVFSRDASGAAAKNT